MKRIVSTIAFAAVATIAFGSLHAARPSPTGATVNAGLTRAAGNDRGPTTPGPIAPQAAERASQTPLGPPPENTRAQGNGARSAIVDPSVPPMSQHKEDVNNGESMNPTSTKLMNYHPGAVQTTPRIYLVFWGANWFTTGDPYGVANRLHYFYGGVGGSSWANVLTQYTSNYGSFSNPAGQYKGWIQDTTTVPANPTKTDIANAARRAAIRMNDYSYNAQYVIAMPWGIVDQNTTALKACAWHDSTYVNGTNWVTYTALPYTPYMDTFGTGCGGGRVNGAAGKLDGVTINAGHEYAETVNDPGANAWFDADGDENGDKCSWSNLQNRTLANGYSFPMQPTWSNQWRNQYGYGCYYS